MKKRLIDQEKSLKEAVNKLIEAEKQHKMDEAEKKQLLLEKLQLQQQIQV